ncbi:MAG: hypothetical protein HY722_15310, partial [Planctomycetes bacterium]|nr:hypothetical protein [Planctomycetota bacterium]
MVEAGSGDDGALLRLYSTAIRRNRLLGDDQLAEALVVHEKVRRLGVRIDLLEVAVAHDLLSDKVVRSLRRLAAARGLSVEDSPRLLQGVTPEADHALGALAAQNLLIPPQALGEALDLQRALRDLGVERRIGELLVERGHLRAEILGDLLVLQAWLRDPRQAATPDAGLVITPEDVRFGKVAIDLGVTEQAAVQEALHLQRTVLERTGLQLPVGEVLYGLGRIAGPDIERVLEEQRRRLEAGAAPALVRLSEEDNDRLGQVLRENRLATPEALDHAAQVQRALRDLGLRRRLGEVLILLGHLSAEDVRAALAVQQARRARRTGVAGGARRAPRAAGSGHGRRVAAVLLGLGALLVVFGVLAWSLLGPPTRGPRSDGEVVATGPEPGDELGGAGTGADALLAVAQEAEAARRLLRVQDLMWDEDVAIEALIGALEQIAERYPGTESGQRAGRLGANYREGLALRAGPPARVHRPAEEGGPEADDAGPGTRGEVGPG